MEAQHTVTTYYSSAGLLLRRLPGRYCRPQVESPLASSGGKFCVCTVPSLRPSHKVHSSRLRSLLRRQFHSYSLLQQSKAVQPDTEIPKSRVLLSQ